MTTVQATRSLRMRASFAALLLLSGSFAHGSWFGKDKPVPDWALEAAKTPTPAYAKDASAVILFDEYLETIDEQGRAVEREREVIRILKPQGRKNTCEVSYDDTEKINYFRVWTIAADEKQYPAQDTDFSEAGDTDVPIMLSTTKTRIAHPSAVDVGATIICESEELMEPYIQEKDWSIQIGIPVVFEALEVDLPASHAHSVAWHNQSPVAPVEVSPNHWRWELKDEPELALRDVPSGPEPGAVAARMSVQWGDAAVDGVDKQWAAIGKWFTKLEAGRPDPSPEITAKTQELIAGAPDFYSKVTRITDYIQKNIRYFVVMRGIGGLQANHAADIFRNQYGDCKDKTTLLISMLQVAGIHGFYVPVDASRGVVDPKVPSLIGNHMITAIEIPADVHDPRLKATVTAMDGHRYLIFDPTDERTPAGNLRSDLQGSFGTLASGDSSQIIALPVLGPDTNGTDQTGNFSLDPDGTLSGSVDASHIGPEGADLRTYLKYTDDKERRDAWETLVAHQVPGATLDSFQFVQPPELDKPLEFHYKLTAHNYAHQAGPLLLVRARVVGSDALPFDDKPRSVPIDLSATGKWHDSFDIAIPAGYVVDETPDPVDVDVDFASYKSSVSVKGNLLHYEREYVVRQVEIPATKAPDFRKLQSAILGDEKGTAVLKKK